MKLVDKLILFTKFLKNNGGKFNLREEIKPRKDYWKDQAELWKDKSLHEEINNIQAAIVMWGERYNDCLDRINAKTKELMREQEVFVLQRDYVRFDTEETTLQLMKERADQCSKEFITEINKDIGKYSEWQYAGIELNPSTGVFSKSILGCDLVYCYTGNVIDKSNVEKQYNPFFVEKRLMYYDDLEKLPQEQLGIAFSVNCYEYLPMDPIKDEMRKVYDILRPGGIFIFSYNDCEHEPGLDFCGNEYRTYQTRELMASMATSMGFDIVSDHDCNSHAYSWMIVKKPGERTTQKITVPLIAIVRQEQ
tara:strand:- start:13028 stop:13948 length:921 start_codon:yes stop_codon:yes gene_type:complete